MPKSKRRLKRRGKVKNSSKKGGSSPYEEPRGYMKTDGESRVCKFDKNHNFIGYATEEEAKNF